jgi:hypothetical protein
MMLTTIADRGWTGHAEGRTGPNWISTRWCSAAPILRSIPQGVPLVIRVFQAADDRRRRADKLGKPNLIEAGRRAQFANVASDLLFPEPTMRLTCAN